MFVLKNKIIGGYRFGQKPWYGSKHLGVDYKASYDPVYAPKNGTIINSFWGTDGGNTIWFRPDGENVVIRLMHLSKFIVKSGHVNEGQQIAVSGNTGMYTTGAHLHVDITKNWSGTFWKNFDNFIDPETYNWSTPQPTPQTVSQPVTQSIFNVRIDKAQAAVRAEATTRSAQVGSKVLYRGDVFKAVGTVTGESISGNNVWYKSAKGNYVWSQGLTRI